MAHPSVSQNGFKIVLDLPICGPYILNRFRLRLRKDNRLIIKGLQLYPIRTFEAFWKGLFSGVLQPIRSLSGNSIPNIF